MSQHNGERSQASRGGVFAAEEGLVEGVDAGVQGGDVGPHFLAEACDVSAHFLAKSGHVLADGGDCSPEAEANPQDGNDDGDGVRVHGPILSRRAPCLQVLQVFGPREDAAERILRPCFSADRSENLGLPTGGGELRPLRAEIAPGRVLGVLEPGNHILPGKAHGFKGYHDGD